MISKGGSGRLCRLLVSASWGREEPGAVLTPPGARPSIRSYRRQLPAWPSSKAITQWREECWAERLVAAQSTPHPSPSPMPWGEGGRPCLGFGVKRTTGRETEAGQSQLGAFHEPSPWSWYPAGTTILPFPWCPPVSVHTGRILSITGGGGQFRPLTPHC